MTRKWLVFSLWLQLFLGFVSLNFIKCDCPFPNEEIINGEYIYRSEFHEKLSNANEGYILFFRCSVGYELSGGNAIQCLDGEWSGEVPSCKAMQCSAPPRISNGTYTFTAKDKTEITIGTQAIYSCKPGYELSDSSVSRLTCILNEDGDETLWAGDLPACQAMKPCSDPGFSMNGTREGDCCLPGNIVSYSCNEGFEMVGEKKIECLSSRSWSSPRPLCRPLEDHCELPPQIPNGVVIRKSGDYALVDEEVEILCKPGYKLNGTNQFPFCNRSALWEDEFGECVEILCDRPEPLENGTIPELEKSNFTDIFPYSFVLTYDCNEGYRLKGGEPWRVCRKDGWSGKTPYCEEIFCPDPGAPEQGSRLGDSFKVGAKVRFKCFTGYELLGSFERYCSPNGKWTGELTRCNAPTNFCPNPGIPINGMRDGNSYDEGNTIKFSCKSGFIHTGSKERTCMADGTWNGTITKCLGPHDFDTTEEIGRNLKNRLNEQFDEEIKEFKMNLAARGLTGEHGRTLDIPTNGRLIVYFAFDVSGSIERINFKKGIEFAKAIVRKIGVSENGARVGALVFSTEPVNYFFPMDFSTAEDVLEQLDLVEYLGGGTSATSALQKVIDNIILEEARPNAFDKNNKKTVLFLITDGKANMGGSPEIEADILKDQMKVEIFCIGITGDVRADSLYQIASTSKYGNEEKANVFMLKNYERLNWLIQDLTNGTIDYSKCGLGMENKMNSNEGKMIGGETSVEPWPWMATLFFRDLKKKAAKPELKCGGSIINENFILTAAHCFFERVLKTLDHRRKTAEEIIVKLGLVDLKNETIMQEFEVKTLYIHEGYTPGDFYDNDIALLKLNKPVTFGPFVRPVCLPPAVLPEDDYYPLYKPNEYGWVIGFGHEKIVKRYEKHVQYKLSKQLKELSLPIQPNKTCSASLLAKEKKFFTERMFCAGDGMAGNDTCKGDSGGPFMQPHMNSQGNVYWTQVGIVSWGIGCGNKGQYGYYTRVHLFRSWIDEKMKEIDPDEEEV